MTNKLAVRLKSLIKQTFRRWGFEISKSSSLHRFSPVEASEYDLETIRLAISISMQSPERLWALICATRYIVHSGVPGDFVECGVYKGSSALVIARTLTNLGVRDRNIWLYDTFTGMTKPGKFDHKSGTFTKASVLLEAIPGVRAVSPILEVKQNLSVLQYPSERFIFVEGDVLSTLPKISPSQISLLRLDTDWYESTLLELEYLYDLVTPQRGLVIIDDYGHWSGCRKATDEFLTNRNLRPLMFRIDYAARMWFKE